MEYYAVPCYTEIDLSLNTNGFLLETISYQYLRLVLVSAPSTMFLFTEQNIIFSIFSCNGNNKRNICLYADFFSFCFTSLFSLYASQKEKPGDT